MVSVLLAFSPENLASLLNSTANTFPPLIVVQACAGPMAGCTAAILTNPMDIIRTRLQVPSSPPSLAEKISSYFMLKYVAKCILFMMSFSGF